MQSRHRSRPRSNPLLQEDLEARIRVLEANLDARVVTVVNRASVEEVGESDGRGGG